MKLEMAEASWIGQRDRCIIEKAFDFFNRELELEKYDDTVKIGFNSAMLLADGTTGLTSRVLTDDGKHDVLLAKMFLGCTLSVLGHELVHVKQHADKRDKVEVKNGMVIDTYDGVPIEKFAFSGIPPWEKEAYAVQNENLKKLYDALDPDDAAYALDGTSCWTAAITGRKEWHVPEPEISPEMDDLKGLADFTRDSLQRSEKRLAKLGWKKPKTKRNPLTLGDGIHVISLDGILGLD